MAFINCLALTAKSRLLWSQWLSHLNYVDYIHEQKRLGIQFNKSDTRDCIGSRGEATDAEPEGRKF